MAAGRAEGSIAGRRRLEDDEAGTKIAMEVRRLEKAESRSDVVMAGLNKEVSALL
jgi:hypothetical protein